MEIAVVDDIEQALAPGAFDQIIDVRSPSEFAEDCLPGAVNLPVLDDHQRAEIGAIYKQVSKFEARRRGAALIALNIARHLQTHLAGKPPAYAPLVYCWRGGQRSGAMAHILNQIGWRVSVLQGGYRTYRRHVVSCLYQSRAWPELALLSGLTGAGKTEILERLAKRSAPVLDLEALAAHRGSVFGAEPDRAQPSQKMFESQLLAAAKAAASQGRALTEAESNRIGALRLPPAIWAAMRAAPVLRIDAPIEERAAYIERRYPEMASDRAQVLALLDSFTRTHGKQQVAEWRRLVEAGEILALVRSLLERHYDPAYAWSQKRLRQEPRRVVRIERLDAAGLDAAAEVVGAALQEI